MLRAIAAEVQALVRVMVKKVFWVQTPAASVGAKLGSRVCTGLVRSIMLSAIQVRSLHDSQVALHVEWDLEEKKLADVEKVLQVAAQHRYWLVKFMDLMQKSGKDEYRWRLGMPYMQ